ncbi:MAG: hypothetical protein JWR20_1665 [Marmoricola sp.]|nr:hypothetical protein [Marmoricola sp.]
MTRTNLRPHVRTVAALSGAAALTALSLAPAVGATVVSRAQASAATITVAGNGGGSGTYAATNDGSRESTTGTSRPPIGVLTGQQVLNTGVLAQEATARTDRTSAACAGLAGNGGSVAQVGDSQCLTPGTPLQATLGSLDLSKIKLAADDSVLAPLNSATVPLTDPVKQQLLKPLNDALARAQAQLGNAGLTATLGAVEGRCTAGPGTASGSANVVNTRVALTLPGQAPIALVDLPVRPAPNTHLTTNLSQVATLVLDAAKADLKGSLNGAASQLTTLTDTVQQQIVDNVVKQVDGQLAPLEQNVLDITLNKQVRPTADSIQVTALDASVLPAAAPVAGSDLAHLTIGHVECGPSGRVAPAAAAAAPEKKAAPLPTAVSSGLASAPTGTQAQEPVDRVVLGAVGLLSLLAGGVVLRRRVLAS